MNRIPCAVVAAAFAVVSACTSTKAVLGPEEVLVLEVAPDSIACVGERVGRCIQVRSPGEEDWRKFYDPIDGFRHEPGVRYTLRVGRREVRNPPADGSAFTYRLIKVITCSRDDRSGAGRPVKSP